jgi:hypothetical protein
VTFSITLTNERSLPLQHDRTGCFVYVSYWVPAALDPFGRSDWTGRAAAFKAYALTQDLTGGGDYGPTAIGGNLETTNCPDINGITTPLAPGATITASFRLDASFGPDLEALPGPVAFRVWAQYTTQEPPVTMPPPPSMCPCPRWIPTLQEIAVRGTLLPGDRTPPMVSIGQVIDAALANSTFRTFIDNHEFEKCGVSLTVPADQGRYLPHRPGWNLGVSCEHPRRFIRAEIDPWTAKVNGIDVCNVSCWR